MQSMSEAVKLIVESVVSLKDRVSVEEMREHRQKLRKELQGRVGPAFDLSQTIRAVENELIIIEDGVALIGPGACQARGMSAR